jgi:hypothetical protein
MSNYQGFYVVDGQTTALGQSQSEIEIPFVVIENEPAANAQIGFAAVLEVPDITEVSPQCCPLADAVARLQQILCPLSARGKRPSQVAQLMQTLYGCLEEIDQTYEHLERALTAEMASLQLISISESNDRRRLVSDLRDVIESSLVTGPEEVAYPVGQLLLDDSSSDRSSDRSSLDGEHTVHPAIEAAAQRLADHQQPVSERFRLLKQQKKHALCHGIDSRKEISEMFKKCGLSGLSKKMRQEAILREMGRCVRPD